MYNELYIRKAIQTVSFTLPQYTGRVKQKRENAQNVLLHIILRMRKVLFGSFLSIDTFNIVE